MLNLPNAFLSIANMFSAALGGPFWAGRVVAWPDPEFDDGGSIVGPVEPTYRTCTVQIDVATEAMRQSEGFADGDVRFIILAASLTGSLDTDANVEVLEGPHAGAWQVSAIERDPAAIGYVGRGRRNEANTGP